MKTILLVCALHSLFFAFFHMLFWSKLNWKHQLKKLDGTNNAVMQILNLRLIFVFLFHSFICFWFAEELLTTSLGSAILLGSSLFWIGRTIEQFVYRKLLDTTHPVSILITVLFVIGSVLYLIPLISQYR